ncbi:MAG TPA: hypothetical protein VMU50_12745 [Polyangia bacterium]|nr:hypothetical protein [Polyangia bacterium]
MRRWFMWIPVLMVASLLFWTVALALGGMSLMAANKISIFESHCRFGAVDVPSDTDGAGSRNGFDPIVVHIEESGEPEDVSDNPGTGLGAAPATDEPAAAEPESPPLPGQPGKTAF